MAHLTYLMSRLAQLVLTVAGVMTVLFVLLRVSGDPAEVLSGPDATPEIVEATRARLGLEGSLLSQYLRFMGDLAVLDLGRSFTFGGDALTAVTDRLGASMLILLPAQVLTMLLGIALGSAVARAGKFRIGQIFMGGSFLLQAVPYFWLAIVLVLFLALQWKVLPATGSGGIEYAIIPIIAMTASHTAALARLARGEVADVLHRPFVLVARSKGISQGRLMFRHVLPVALPPIISYSGILFAFSVGQLVVLEPLFNYRGIGALLVNAVHGRDFPIVMAGVFVVTLMVGLVNLLADVVNRLIDSGLRTKVGVS